MSETKAAPVQKIAGIAAEFDTPRQLLDVCTALREAGFKKMDSYTPFPVHGIERAMGLGDSHLGWIVLLGGIAGFVGGFGLQAYASAIAYPLTISGKPFLSTPAFIPITFECTVLFAAFATVFGMLALNKLPAWYRAIFNYPKIWGFSNDKFIVSVEATDPRYDEQRLRGILTQHGGKHIEQYHD